MEYIVVTENMLQDKQRKMIRDAAEECGFPVFFYDSIDAAKQDGAFEKATIWYGGGLAPFLQQMPNLKWVCSSWAGVDAYCKPGVMPEGAILTNASGAYGVTLAEYAVMVTLMLLRRQPEYEEDMRTIGWHGPLREQHTIKDSRVTLLGAGDIGQRYAERIRGFAPEKITALNRSGRSSAACFDEVRPISDLEDVLPETDILMMSLPGTPETENILGRRQLQLLPPHAYVINVGRGSAIDEDAMVTALNEGWIAGAALDVMKQEPIPADHPLWTAKNVILTPHIAGNMTTDHTRTANASIFCDNLQRFCKGDPLNHLVDCCRGY